MKTRFQKTKFYFPFSNWKKIYQLVSGAYYNENQEIVKKRLLSLHTEIQSGIEMYKKPIKTSDANEEMEKMLKDKSQERLIPFAQKLVKYLDLDVKQSFDLLCHYLVNEYRGSASSLQNFLSNESLMIKLLNDIWFYYSLERMILLKVVKCVIEFHEVQDHPYQEAFKAVMDKIGIANLRKSYIDQFEKLVKDVYQTKHLPGDIFNSPLKLQSWSERKNREINEILQIITLIIHFDGIKPDEINKLLDLCKNHAFGNLNQFLNPNHANHLDLIQKVNFSEVVLLVVALSKYSVEKSSWLNEVIEKIDEKIIAMHNHHEHGPILLSWMIFKMATRKNDSMAMDIYTSYAKLGARAVQLNVFGYLHKIVTHRQFNDKSLLSKVFVRCVFDNLEFLCELFNSDGSMAQHPMIFELFSELLKFPTVAKEFCKNENCHSRSLFDAAVQLFPHEFVPLSIMAESLAIASLPSFAWVMNYLQNLPVYAEMPCDPSYELRRDELSEEEDAYLLLSNYQPFPKISDYIIRADNRAIVRNERGNLMVYFLSNLNYFQALHHEINELLSCIQSFTEIKEIRLKRLEAGINLLAVIIRQLKNADEITNEMIHPTEMVFDILEKLKVFQHPPLDLMASCVNVFAELLPFFSDEIFRRFVNLNLSPTITTNHKEFKGFANGNGVEMGIVGYYLINIERTNGKYSFLKAYFNFLQKCSKVSCKILIPF
jgi:nuclear pore complex protein Nup188